LWQALHAAGGETGDIPRQELFASLATAPAELDPGTRGIAAVTRLERAAVLDAVGTLARRL
jgi:hypothetical protein